MNCKTLNFVIIIDIIVLTLYTKVKVFKNITVFILSFVVCNSSKHLMQGLPNVEDVLIYRAGILMYDIFLKYFRTLAFNVEVFRNFIGGIC